jgi:hypothetical protein
MQECPLRQATRRARPDAVDPPDYVLRVVH